MVDVGGGSFLRFGEAGARLSDLDLLAISHFHPDHVSDLPGLLWLSDTQREAALRIAGPYGSEAFPSLDGFLSRLFDAQAGAFQVLSGTLGGPGRGVLLDPVAPDPGRSGPTVVLDREDIIVRALPVPHGAVPALAYRVEVDGVSVVFSSDQNGSDPRFVEFSRGATALVMHFATRSPGSALHASPEVVGQVAADAGVQQLILSHLFSSEPVEGARRYNLAYLEGSVAQVRARYSGVVRVGEDLACYAL
jgi:ribonuclease BN (tRNA processing enzyme)